MFNDILQNINIFANGNLKYEDIYMYYVICNIGLNRGPLFWFQSHAIGVIIISSSGNIVCGNGC